MAFKTTDWDRVEGLTQARLGLYPSAEDQDNIAFLINSAADYIFDESRYWPRFLVLEPRTVSRGYIATSEDSFNVYGSGSDGVDGLYVSVDDVNALPAYSQFSDGVATHTIKNDGAGDWVLTDDDSGDILYVITSAEVTPPEGAWDVDQGEAPSPIVQALSEINEYIGHWDGARWVGGDPNQMSAYPDQNGIRVTAPYEGTVYVAYKKENDVIYGDGTGGTTTDVPSEWVDYIAISAAREYRASQSNPEGYNPIAIRDVDNRMNQALIKISKQGVYDTLANQFKTRYGMDISVR